MKIRLLCLCFLFLLSGCSQSFEKDNVNLSKLEPKLRTFYDVPLVDTSDSLSTEFKIELAQIEDKIILVSPFTYPKQCIVLVHSIDPQWNDLFHQYIEQLKLDSQMMKNNDYYDQHTKIGTIHQYTYFIVSENSEDIINYLLGK